ncbi:helix-turn-helix transcriptional regulator [Altererythrobacter salegens]|uniref:Helix-turn-helix transcriptional regulator n=1 Tax=Croceibacterium salegens TaxID=1737568 RepID=A0A6I4SY49_9SPHN|nr:helix-turn-helix transcriptional regulator [Croceibacterium salegens]MXO59242.1 helix-turn-helix transcriptional regulator [Croceibacterium salegens]
MRQSTTSEEGEAGGLTPKQVEVLDLLIEHKTSKEIARELDISPYTVDQRINFAKDKLGVRTRGEAAVAYRRLLETYDQIAYGNSGIVPGPDLPDERSGPQGSLPEPAHSATVSFGSQLAPEADFRVVPELFDGRYGTIVRLGSIVVIAMSMIFVVLGGLAIYSELSQILR